MKIVLKSKGIKWEYLQPLSCLIHKNRLTLSWQAPPMAHSNTFVIFASISSKMQPSIAGAPLLIIGSKRERKMMRLGQASYTFFSLVYLAFCFPLWSWRCCCFKTNQLCFVVLKDSVVEPAVLLSMYVARGSCPLTMPLSPRVQLRRR